MRAWKMIVGTGVSMSLALLGACTPGAREAQTEQAIADPRYGARVYQMDEALATQTSQDAFLERCYGRKAVYLSAGSLVWMEGNAVHNHPDLPDFLSRLYNNLPYEVDGDLAVGI